MAFLRPNIVQQSQLLVKISKKYCPPVGEKELSPVTRVRFLVLGKLSSPSL
jgi:hypothetical protein